MPLFTLCLASFACLGAGDAFMTPYDLRCEYVVNPLAVDESNPRLSWKLRTNDDTVRGLNPMAWQVIVASDKEKLARDEADLWDSGKVASRDSINIEYAGKALMQGQRANWKVRIWTRPDVPGPWSEIAWWEPGVPGFDKDGAAQWISDSRPMPENEADLYGDLPAPMLRHEFKAKGEVVRARAYIAAAGYYELRINGKKVGDHVLDPGWTAYDKRTYYAAYDVTGQIQNGDNAVGVVLGNGWRNPLPLRFWGHINICSALPVGLPCALLRVDVEYADGARESWTTDDQWKAGDSAIIRNNIYLGEKFDARAEQAGWDKPGFDDSAWRGVKRVTEGLGPVQAQMCPPIKVGRVIKTVGVKEIKPGVHLFDLGENFAGVIRLRVSGKAGDTVVMRYGELLNDDGTLNPMTSCAGQIKNGRNGSPGVPETAWQSDTYILRGGEAEEYVPRFTFHGFRYVEVTGLPGAPTTDTILGLAQHASVDSAGVFTCANDMFNKVQEVTRRTLLSNLFSVQSDCPHREKFGYGGDIVASSGMAMFNFDMTQFYIKSVRDLQDAVRPNGGFTETAPYVSISDAGLGEKSGPIGWGTAHPLLLWQLYKFTGNTRLIEEQYPYVQRWIELLNSKAQDGLLDNGIGDHETIADKSTLVSGTVFYHLNLTLAARLADILGKIDDVTRYSAQAQAVREALNTRVLKDGLYAIGTQACQAMPLYTGMVPEEVRESVLQGLVRDIESHDNHLTTGIFGTPAMLFALTNNGRADVAYRIADQRTFPGWGHMLERGATTLWEHWEFSDNTFSHNHPMFGSISEWFFRSLAGINEASDAKGFDRIEFRPNPVSGLASAEAQYESVRGKVECRWIVENGRFKVGVRIPAGATAKLFLPIAEGVEEGGKPFAVAKTPSGSIAALESGIYLFSMPVK